MTEPLVAPDAPFRLAAPIEHITKLDDGTVLLHCTVTSEAPDSQGEIVDYDAFKAAAPGLMKWAVLGEMHDPTRQDAGTILKLYFDDAARKVEADVHVVDPTAVKKVLARVYKMVSIGGTKLATTLTRMGDQTYKRITRLVADELSLVPRGANPDAHIAKQFVLAKRAQEPDMTETVTLDAGVSSPLGEPGTDLSETRTPAQIAIDETREALAKDESGPPEGGKDRADIPAEDFAGPDKSFPIVTPASVDDAAKLIGHAADPAAVKANIIRIARRKGPAFVAALPDSWKDGKKARKMKKTMKHDVPGEQPEAPPTVEKAETPAEEAAESPAEEAAETPAEEAAEQEQPKAKSAKKSRKMAKRVAKLRKANRVLRKEKRLLKTGGEAVIAKYGKAVSGEQMGHLSAAHDAICKAGYMGCMAKAETGETPALETTSVETAAVLEGAVISKADPSALIKEALEPISRGLAEAVEARLAALDEKSAAQGELLAKIAKSPTGGGPATPYAPVMRGNPEVTDKASALELAASVLGDDPRAQTRVGQAAAFELIRRERG